MTSIILRPSWVVDDGTEPILPAARYFIRPTNTYAGSTGQVLNIFGPAINIAGAAVTITLDPSSTGAGPYEFKLAYKDVTGTSQTLSRTSTVPDSGSYALEALPDLGPTSGSGAPFSSADHAALVALQAQVNAMSGGATNLAGITDMSGFMRTVNTSIDAPAARTAIGAGTSSGGGGTNLAGISDMSAFSRTANTGADAAAWRTTLGVSTGGSLAIGTTTGTAADGGVVAALGTTVAGHTTALAGKIDSSTKGQPSGVAALDSSGRVLDFASTIVAGVGNAVMIFGAATARVHPQGGYALPAGTSVIWIAASSPTNMTTADLWINDPSA